MQGTRRAAFFVPLPRFWPTPPLTPAIPGHAISDAGVEKIAFEWQKAAEGDVLTHDWTYDG